MAIRFDPDYNAYIRRIVYNFNRKRNRAIKRGIAEKFLPEKRYVSKLKASFNNRRDLDRELENLQKFNELGMDAFSVVETMGGGRTSQYNLDYIKANLKSTKEFYDQQIEELSAIVSQDKRNHDMDAQLVTLQRNREYLDLDIAYLDESGLETFNRLIKKKANYNHAQVTGYRGFLTIVETAMNYLGYDKEIVDSFFGKLSNLSPAQFLKLYRSSDVINRIYELIPSPPIKGRMFNTDDEDAKRMIDILIRDFDQIKEDALQ